MIFLKFLVVPSMLLMASCDLSKYPIDDPAVIKVDNRLVGRWKNKSKSDDKTIYRIVRKDDFHYEVTAQAKKKSERESYIAFLSDVNNVSFLNIVGKDAKDDSASEKYSFLKLLEVSEHKITAASVKDTTLKNLNSPSEVRARITKNLNNPEYYGDTTLFVKMKK